MQSHTSDLVGFLSPFGLHLQTCKGRKTGKHEEVKHKLTQKEENEIGFRRKKNLDSCQRTRVEMGVILGMGMCSFSGPLSPWHRCGCSVCFPDLHCDGS